MIVHRWPTLDDLLPAPDLAMADTARMTAIGPRRPPMPTLVTRPWVRSRPLLRWGIAACALVLGALIVVATIDDRQPTSASFTIAVDPPALPSGPDAQPTVDHSDEMPPPSMALAEAAPIKIAKRSKRPPVRTRRARWNPEALFLAK